MNEIVKVEMREGSAFILTSWGEEWRMWLDADGHPLIELYSRGGNRALDQQDFRDDQSKHAPIT